MKILFVASEAVPFVKTGGLADVVGALAPVLAEKGHDVRVLLPDFGQIPREYHGKMTHACDFEVQLGWRRQYCGIEQIQLNGVTWYFMDNKYYFDRPYIYGMGGDEYERFGFFCRGALTLSRLAERYDSCTSEDTVCTSSFLFQDAYGVYDPQSAISGDLRNP